jgi:alpha-beta hydrolase superfamily lysophospholipase
MQADTGQFDGRGGLSIAWRAWLPEDEPKAVLVLAHGAGEHSGRYGHVAHRLNQAGYAVHALDHRGHGHSEGRRAYLDRMENVVDDLHTFVRQAKERHPGKPLFLLGHSMGGCIAIEYALAHQDELTGLALTCPLAVLEAANPVQRAAGRILSAVLPQAPVFRVDSALVSRDPKVVRRYDEDPLVHHGGLPARTVGELAQTVARFPERVPEIEVPLLVMLGGADELVPPEGGRMVAERAGSADKTLEEYDGLYHEILNEPDWEKVADDLVGWLDGRVPRAH